LDYIKLKIVISKLVSMQLSFVVISLYWKAKWSLSRAATR